jgi:hypothetical protein
MAPLPLGLALLIVWHPFTLPRRTSKQTDITLKTNWPQENITDQTYINECGHIVQEY